MTVGRHLDNDLVIAGEDVRDFHVRIEITERGPRVIVLEGATAYVDESDRKAPGYDRRRARAGPASFASGGGKLHPGLRLEAAPRRRRHRRVVNDTQRRSGDRLRPAVVEGHVSRHHAQLRAERGAIWLEDLRSANGTYVNGDRVAGAWRVFHGDEISFDTIRYQLIGDAPDLTPIRPLGQPPDQLEVSERIVGEPARAETAEIANVTVEAGALPTATPIDPDPAPTGPMLIGRSAPVTVAYSRWRSDGI